MRSEESPRVVDHQSLQQSNISRLVCNLQLDTKTYLAGFATRMSVQAEAGVDFGRRLGEQVDRAVVRPWRLDTEAAVRLVTLECRGAA
jgi:hypothetical protein